MIVVNEQNGSVTEEKRTVKIMLPAELPVDPLFSISLLKARKFIYSGDKYTDENGKSIAKDEALTTSIVVTDVKGDGNLIAFLVNKKHDHRPESVDKIDFSKVIVTYPIDSIKWSISPVASP